LSIESKSNEAYTEDNKPWSADNLRKDGKNTVSITTTKDWCQIATKFYWEDCIYRFTSIISDKAQEGVHG